MASQSTEYFFKESFKARDPNHSFRKNTITLWPCAVIHSEQGSISDSFCCSHHWLTWKLQQHLQQSRVSSRKLLSTSLPSHFLLSSCARPFSQSHFEPLYGKSCAATTPCQHHCARVTVLWSILYIALPPRIGLPFLHLLPTILLFCSRAGTQKAWA